MTSNLIPTPEPDKLKNELVEQVLCNKNSLLFFTKTLAGVNEGTKKAYENISLGMEPERVKLRALSVAELQAQLATQERQRVENSALNARQAEARKLEKAKNDEASKFYNLASASADFEHWSKAEYWTLEEAVSLLLGKDPRVVSWETLKPYHPASNPFTFLAGQKPAPTTGFLKKYERLLDLASRWQTMKNTQRLAPHEVLDWARHTEAAEPDLSLVAMVARKTKAHTDAKQTATENAGDAKVQNATPQLPSPTDSRPTAGTPEKWTHEKRVEMRAHKEENGTKKTAEHYGMTENRVRQILAKDPDVIGQKSIGNSVFTQRLK